MRDSHSKAVLIVAILGAFVTGVELGSSADSWSEKGAQKKKRAKSRLRQWRPTMLVYPPLTTGDS